MIAIKTPSPDFERTFKGILLSYSPKNAVEAFLKKGDSASILRDSGISNSDVNEFLDVLSQKLSISGPFSDVDKKSSSLMYTARQLWPRLQIEFPDLTIGQVRLAAQLGYWPEEYYRVIENKFPIIDRIFSFLGFEE